MFCLAEGVSDMMFTLVLGVMVGGAAVVLLQQWVRDTLGGGERPIRLVTPAGSSFIQHAVAPRRRAA